MNSGVWSQGPGFQSCLTLAFELGDLQLLEPQCTPLYNRDHDSIYLARLSWQQKIAGVTHAC